MCMQADLYFKKEVQAGNESLNLPPKKTTTITKPLHARKKPPPSSRKKKKPEKNGLITSIFMTVKEEVGYKQCAEEPAKLNPSNGECKFGFAPY